MKREHSLHHIQVYIPLKEGLRLEGWVIIICIWMHSSLYSIKRRIKTRLNSCFLQNSFIQVYIPLKEGLRQSKSLRRVNNGLTIQVYIPLKEGLRPLAIS